MREPVIALVTAAGATNDARKFANMVRAEAKSREISYSTFQGKKASVAGEPWDKPVRMLPGPQAHDLYGLLHRQWVLVVAFGQVYVARNPAHTKVARRHAATIEEFVAYKAAFRTIRRDTDVQAAFDLLDAWCTTTGCTGDSDPRALPFHMFDRPGEWPDLDTKPGRERFRRRFGPDKERVDKSGRRWSRASRHAYHGQSEQLHVARREFARGMHWDVTGTPQTEIANAREIWQYKTRNDYINIEPDGHIRGGQGSSQASKVWPK